LEVPVVWLESATGVRYSELGLFGVKLPPNARSAEVAGPFDRSLDTFTK
jgi:hypothetical protein